MSDEPRDTPLEHLLSVFGEGLLDGVRVSLPGRITAYDAARQKVSIKPLIKHAHLGENEERVVQSLPEIHGAPVVFWGPARGRITWPVAVDDLCLVIFCSSSIARWLVSGGEVDPGDDRRHDLNDAVALVGLHSYRSVPTTAPTDAIVFHAGAGVDVRVGSPLATQRMILGDAYRTAEDIMLTAQAAAWTAAAAAFTALGQPAAATAATAAASAISTFQGGALGYLATKGKVI